MFALLTDHSTQDPTGWLMSEKLDGWRVMWTGKQFVTRAGKVIDAPRAWIKGMPKTALDGELFGGRGSLYEIKAMMKDGWRGLSFHPFDAPAHPGPFVDRLAYLQTLTLPAHCSLVTHTICDSLATFQAAACATYANGGEGCVVRDPLALYAVGRTKTIQRLVPYPLALHRRRPTPAQ